jgi:hypothetical protein
MSLCKNCISGKFIDKLVIEYIALTGGVGVRHEGTAEGKSAQFILQI